MVDFKAKVTIEEGEIGDMDVDNLLVRNQVVLDSLIGHVVGTVTGTPTITAQDNPAAFSKSVSRSYIYYIVPFFEGRAGIERTAGINRTAVPYAENYQIKIDFSITGNYDEVKIYRRISDGGTQISPAVAYDMERIATIARSGSTPITTFTDDNSASPTAVWFTDELYAETSPTMDTGGFQPTDGNVIHFFSKTAVAPQIRIGSRGSRNNLTMSQTGFSLNRYRASGAIFGVRFQPLGFGVDAFWVDTEFALTGNFINLLSNGVEKFRVNANGEIFASGNRVVSTRKAAITKLDPGETNLATIVGKINAIIDVLGATIGHGLTAD